MFTALAVPLAALGQVVITGRALPLSLVAAATATVFAFAMVLSGSRRRFLQISAVLVPVELLLNTAFNLGQDTCAAAVHSHGVDLLVCGGGSLGADSPFAGANSGMWMQLLVLLMHLVLALAAAAWLNLGDAALTRVCDAVSALRTLLAAPVRTLRLLAPLPGSPAVLTPVRAAEPAPARAEDVVLSPAPRRGPPALALAC